MKGEKICLRGNSLVSCNVTFILLYSLIALISIALTKFIVLKIKLLCVLAIAHLNLGIAGYLNREMNRV